MLLRDLPGKDLEMDLLRQERGLVEVPMFNSHYVDPCADEAAWLAGMSRKKRQGLRKILDRAGSFQRHHPGHGQADKLSEEQVAYLYQLYRNVADRKLKLNLF